MIKYYCLIFLCYFSNLFENKACECPPPVMDAQKAFPQYKYVFEVVCESSNGDYPWNYTLNILKWYKGRSWKLRLHSEADGCGKLPKIGKRWLVFTNNLEDASIINMCSPSIGYLDDMPPLLRKSTTVKMKIFYIKKHVSRNILLYNKMRADLERLSLKTLMQNTKG